MYLNHLPQLCQGGVGPCHISKGYASASSLLGLGFGLRELLRLQQIPRHRLALPARLPPHASQTMPAAVVRKGLRWTEIRESATAADHLPASDSLVAGDSLQVHARRSLLRLKEPMRLLLLPSVLCQTTSHVASCAIAMLHGTAGHAAHLKMPRPSAMAMKARGATRPMMSSPFFTMGLAVGDSRGTV